MPLLKFEHKTSDINGWTKFAWKKKLWRKGVVILYISRMYVAVFLWSLCPLFIFSQKKAFQKIMKMLFLISKELFSFWKNSIFCTFFLFLFTFSRCKRSDETRIIKKLRTGLRKLTSVIFEIIQKPLCFELWKLPRS